MIKINEEYEVNYGYDDGYSNGYTIARTGSDNKTEDKLVEVRFNINSGYQWGGPNPGMSREAHDKFYKEIIDLFESNGFIVRKDSSVWGGCPRAYKSGTDTNLYIHPMEITGTMMLSDFNKVKNFLNDGMTFVLTNSYVEK